VIGWCSAGSLLKRSGIAGQKAGALSLFYTWSIVEMVKMIFDSAAGLGCG
jgi:hypothetical protein